MLELINVSKTFNAGTVNEKKALSDINLSVKDGDFITIIGSNGAGKSTLFGAVSGAFIPDTGRIVLDGNDITRTPDYKRASYIGRLFQDPKTGTAPSMTVEENLLLAAGGGRYLSLPKKSARERLRQRVASLGLGLEDRMKTPVGLLSGGQRQALTLLMAAMQKPKLLLLDEHTAALDPRTAAKVLELSDRIVEENHLTTLMITHNMKDAIAHGNRLIMMDAGHIVLDISGEEKKKLTVTDLLTLFSKASGTEANDDKLLLS